MGYGISLNHILLGTDKTGITGYPNLPPGSDTIHKDEAFTVILDNWDGTDTIIAYLQRDEGEEGYPGAMPIEITAGTIVILGDMEWEYLQHISAKSVNAESELTRLIVYTGGKHDRHRT